MRRSLTPLSLLLAWSVAVGPVLSPLLAPTARADDSAATTALTGIKSALDTTNGFVSTLQYSQAQVQQMYNQFTNLNGQNAKLNQNLSALDQVKQNLSLALATAQGCVLEAENKKNGKMAKYKKATITSASAFQNVNPTCQTYGNVIDSGRRLADQLASAKEKAACMRQLQNTLDSVADQSKTAFNQVTQAANDVWNTRDMIITSNENIAKRIDGDLNGDNGYKAQLGNLEKMSNDIYQKINAGMTQSKDGAGGGGFGARLRQLKTAHNQAGNKWFSTFMQDVNSCFTNSQLDCGNGITASPLSCIAQNLGAGNAANGDNASTITGVARAQGSANMVNLQRTLTLSSTTIANATKQAKLDVTNENQFLDYTNQQFQKMVSQIVGNFRNQKFYGRVDKTQLGNFITAKYQECYDNAKSNFKADMAGDGAVYKASLTGISEAETGINAEIKGLIDQAQSQMNDFRTAFHKVYNNDLPQFSADCTASDDAYQSLDCLRMLSATLKSGISGTNETVKLDNKLAGSGLNQFTAKAPTSGLTIQNITLDSTGRPTIGNTNLTCVGFKECINVLDKTRQDHVDAAESQKQERTKFVQDSNKNVQTSMATIAAQFTEVGKLFGTEVEKLNKELAAAGVATVLKTNVVKGKALETDDKTGLYKTPDDMKSAIAGQGTLLELADADSSIQSIGEQFSEVSKKVQEAYVKKAKCQLRESDYKAVATPFPSCDAEKVCGVNGSSVSRMLRSLETLMQKSQKDVDSSADRGQITSRYQSCVRDAKTVKSDSDSDYGETLRASSDKDRQALLDMRKQDREQLKADRKQGVVDCGQQAVDDIDALAGDSRDSVRDKNTSITEAAKRIAASCPDDKEEAASACQALKSAASHFTPPDEGETKVDGDGSSSGTGEKFTDPLGSKSAK